MILQKLSKFSDNLQLTISLFENSEDVSTLHTTFIHKILLLFSFCSGCEKVNSIFIS